MQTLLMTLGGVAAIALGAALGFQLALSRERRAGGGKSAKEIKAEFESYQSSVSEHFMESATLLQGMTEQYKKVYEHMARGAQDLCDVGEERPELAALRSGLLAAALATDASAETDANGNVVDAEAGTEDDLDKDEDAASAASAGADEGAAEAPDAASDDAQRPDEAGDETGGEGTSDPSSFDFGTPLGGGATEAETDAAEPVSVDGDTPDADASASERATGDQTPDAADEGESDAQAPSSAEAPTEDVAAAAAADTPESGAAPADDETRPGAESEPEDGDEAVQSSGTKVPGDQGWAERFRASGGSD